jgi:methyl-accepting chemotaxis protein
LKLLYNDPEVKIVGIADIDKDVSGKKLAKEWGIPASENFQDFFKDKIDTIIDVTGNERVAELLKKIKPPEAEIMGGLSAKLMWDLIMERELRLEEKNGMLREKAKQLEQTQLELKARLEELEKIFRLSLNRE